MASPKNIINKLNDISFLISKIVKDSTHVIQLKGSLMAQKLTEGKRGKKKKKTENRVQHAWKTGGFVCF